MKEGRFQGMMMKIIQRQFLSQNKCLYPIDQKDFFKFIACLKFSIFSIVRAKAQKRPASWLGKKVSQSPFLCPHPWAKWVSEVHTLLEPCYVLPCHTLFTIFVVLLHCSQVGHGLQLVVIAAFQRRKTERQLVRNKP